MHLSLAFPEFLCIGLQGEKPEDHCPGPSFSKTPKPRASTFNFSMAEGGLWHSACWELIQFLWHLFVCLWWKSHKQLTAVNEGWDQPYGWSFGAAGIHSLFPLSSSFHLIQLLQATRTICSFWDHFRITYQQIFPLEGSIHTSVHQWIRIKSVKWPPSDLMSLKWCKSAGNAVRWDHTHTH